MKRTFNKLIRGEKGQALIIVLVLMLVGGLIIAPLLSHMSTGIWVGKVVYEEKMYRLYAADSGIEDALWQVKNERLTSLPGFGAYDQYKYSAFSSSYKWSYNLYDIHHENVNDKDVTITLENVWIPKDISAPDYGQAKLIIEGTPGNPPPLIIVGSMPATNTYQIKIIYYYGGSSDPTGQNLKVDKIGIWLPPGFGYDGNCTLASDTDTDDYGTPVVTDYRSGKAVVWSFGSLALYKFPPTTSGSPMVKSFTFKYTGPLGQSPGAALSWINTDTDLGGGLTYTWDADTKVYKLLSTATDATEKQVEVEAYAAKVEMRQLGTAMSGDYVAVGNFLLKPSGTTGVDREYRDQLYLQNDATIQNSSSSGAGYIPPGATVEAAYLYWSGWIDYHYWYWKTTTPQGWRWSSDSNNDTGLQYPSSPTPTNLTALVETNAKVNTVKFNGNTIITHNWQVQENENHPRSWSYSCFYDVTDLKLSDDVSAKQHIEDAMKVTNGTYTFTLGHADAVVSPPTSNLRPGFDGSSSNQATYMFDFYGTSNSTGYPLGTPATKLSGQWNTAQGGRVAYAGWSLIIIYSSPATKGHQLYLYDDLRNCGSYQTLQFSISGFLAPDEIKTGGDYAAKLTCFVGDGDDKAVDSDYGGDRISIKGQTGTETYLSNTQSPSDDVWNSKSPGLQAAGVDIDTFTVNYPAINPGDTLATVKMPTQFDQYNLIYIILSFRSTITTGGTITYLVRG